MIINCPNCRRPDSLEHLLHECTLMPHLALHAEAKAAGLPTEKHELGSWLLGAFALIDPELIPAALEISSRFLLAAASVRKL